MGDSRFDIQPFLRQKEGQHFERKSMWHGPAGKKRPRDRRKVREEAAEYVVPLPMSTAVCCWSGLRTTAQ